MKVFSAGGRRPPSVLGGRAWRGRSRGAARNGAMARSLTCGSRAEGAIGGAAAAENSEAHRSRKSSCGSGPRTT